MKGRLTPAQAMAAVATSDDGEYGVLFKSGSREIGYYRPRGEDRQTPHDEDEIYLIHRGSGAFMLDGERLPFVPGDVFVVPAGVGHRFVDFSDDFAAWVVFCGSAGDASRE